MAFVFEVAVVDVVVGFAVVLGFAVAAAAGLIVGFDVVVEIATVVVVGLLKWPPEPCPSTPSNRREYEFSP